MVLPLDEQYNWEELCEYTLSRIRLAKKDIPTFRKWFKEREILGWRFDHVMVLRCFRIWQELKNNLDHFVVISGREGFGKSTLAFQLAAWVNPNFNVENICYDARGFLNILSKRAKGLTKQPEDTRSVVMDEGTELLSRESQNLTNRLLVKSFFIQRALKFLVIICIPNFHMLDSVVRNHRVRTLIEVVGRGKYKAIAGKGIKIVAKEGQVTKQVDGIRIPEGLWWNGDFRKPFPKTLDYSKYEEHKYWGINDALNRMNDDIIEKKFLAASKVAKQLDISPGGLNDMIKAGRVKGKQIGKKWFIPKKEYDRLQSMG